MVKWYSQDVEPKESKNIVIRILNDKSIIYCGDYTHNRNKEWIDKNEKFLPIDKVYQNTMALMNRLSMNIKIKTMNTALINNMIKLYNQSMILMQQRKILLDNQLKASSQL